MAAATVNRGKNHETLASGMMSVNLAYLVQFIMRQSKQRGHAVVASLLAGLVLLLNAMAAGPALHELIHKDAGKSDHECAVTMFAHGQMGSALADVPLVAPQIFAENLPALTISVFRPAIENLPAGRGPPVSSSNS
jgi:hypothetical protein